MPDDILPFLAGITILVLYLCWPWRKSPPKNPADLTHSLKD